MQFSTTILTTTAMITTLLGSLSPASADQAMVRMTGDWEPVQGGKSLNQHLRFANDLAAYGLTYQIAIPDGTPPNKCTSNVWAFKSKDVTLGMTSPIAANWYTQAFSSVRIDGLSLHDIPGTFRVLRSGGPDALAEGTWQTPTGPFAMRLLMRAGDDKLIVQYVLPPENSASRLEVRLVGYPHDFKKPWNRHMATSIRDIASQTGVTLDPAGENWALFYDLHMWQEGIGGGPCGFVYVAEEVEPVRVNVGPYSVTVNLRTKPDARKITVGLWDFTVTPDVSAVRDYLRSASTLIQNDIAAVAESDWPTNATPAAHLAEQRHRELAQLVALRRQPTPYDTMTSEVVTPHVAWGKPLEQQAIRALVVAPRWYQRETVELAQRLDLDYQTVSLAGPEELFDARWLYLYESYDAYGFTRKSEVDVLDELSRAVTAAHDCIVLSGFRPEIIPRTDREKLLEKVRAGTGLILLGHCRKLLDQFDGSLTATSWDPQVIPTNHLPGLDKLTMDGRLPWRAYRYGKGHVLVFDYDTGNTALTPSLSHDQPDVLGYYDYYHSLIAAGVLWVSGRGPNVRIRFADEPGNIVIDSKSTITAATLEIMNHDPARQYRHRSTKQIHLRQGTNEVSLPSVGLPNGPRFVSVWVKRTGNVLGWATGWWDVSSRTPGLKCVRMARTTFSPNEHVEGVVELTDLVRSGRIELELWDTDGRLLEKQGFETKDVTIPFRFRLRPTNALLLDLHIRLMDADRLLDQVVTCLTVPDRSIDDYNFLVWSSGQNQAVRHWINRQLGAHGVDWIDNTGLTDRDRLCSEVYCRNAARFGLRSIPYITRIASVQESGRERRPCLHDPEYRESWTTGLQQRAAGSRQFGPPAYTLGDENFLVNRRLDVCISEPSLKAFRDWLAVNYETLGRFNACWKTDWTNWADVVPASFDEVKEKPDLWPRWVDHRLFMECAFTDIHALGREAIRQADPGARVGFDGVFSLDSWHGYDFYQLAKTCDLVQVYASRGQQLEYLRCWHQKDAVRGAWYNHIGNVDETSAKWLGWHLLLHDMNSSWYWTSYNTGPALLFPDLRPAPQLLWMKESIDEIKTGIGQLILAAERQHDGIAVHYSQASVHAGALTDRSVEQVQWGFMRLIEDLGLQYDVLSTDQIVNDKLAGYRVLLMPASAALAGDEAVAIRDFVKNGGLVLADTLPGWLDNHCQMLETGQLDDLFGVRRSGLPQRDGNAVVQITTRELRGDSAIESYDAALRADTADSWAAAGTVPAVLVRQSGKGLTVVLNADVSQYESLRATAAAQLIQRLVQCFLDKAGVSPLVRVVDGDGNHVPACEISRFVDGDCEYVGIVRDHRLPGVKAEQVTVLLPRDTVVFDVRQRRKLKAGREVQAILTPGEPLILALCPRAVPPPSIAPISPGLKLGDTASCQVAFLDKEMTRHRCLHVEIIRPDGACPTWHSKNVITAEHAIAVSIPLALNDLPGNWTLRVTDVATGNHSSIVFHVDPCTPFE